MSRVTVRQVSDILNSLQPTQSTPPVESPVPRVYRSQAINFSAYVLAANLLRYAGAQLAANGKDVEFLFFDPEARGPDLLRRYNAAAAELVNARVLYEVRGYLLSEVKRLQAEAGNGTHQD